MAGDTEDIVFQITGSTKQFENAIKKALGIVKGAGRDMETAFERAGQSMDGTGAKATKLQRQIEALAGASGGMQNRAADIEAYGNELDRLRSKYNPLFAAQQQYIKTLDEINRAAKVGAISEKERVAAFDKTKSAFAAQVKGIRGVSEANTEIAKTGELAGYELINLSRQLQDVFVSIASGQAPTTVFIQQGTQIADIYGSSKNGTVGGSIKQLGGIIASVITPMRLLGLGVAAGGALALASLSSWKSYTLQLDDTAKSAGASTQELAKLQAAASIKGITLDDFNKGIEQFGKGVYEAKNNMGGLAELLRVNGMRASNFEDALGKVADLIKNAKNDQQALAILQQAGLPATMQWVRLLSSGKDGLKAAKDAAVLFGDSADKEMIDKARQFDEAWNKTTTNFSQGWRNAAVNAGGYIQALIDKLPKATPLKLDLPQGVKSAYLANALKNGRGTTLTADSDVSSSYSFMQPKGSGNTKPPETADVIKDRIAKEQQYLGLLGQTTSAAEARRQVELQLQAAAIAGVGVDSKRAEVLKKLAEENVLGITAMKQQADAYRVEAGAIGMSVGQATAYVATQNALNEARRNGRALTAQNIKDINDEAAALGRAAQAAAQLKLSSDIKFERSQIGLSDGEQAANSRVRSVFGDDVNSAQAQFYKQQLLVNEAMRQYNDMGKDAFKGLAQDILAGKSAMEALSGALNKIASKLIDMAADSLWSSAFGGKGAAGLGGFFSSIFGGGGGASSTIQVGNQLFPKFASGTNFAPGGMALVGERGPELVNLPRGAQVIPNHMLPSIPTGAANDNSSVSVSVGGATVVVQGDASEKTLTLINQALKQHDSTLAPKVVAAVQDARKRRVLG